MKQKVVRVTTFAGGGFAVGRAFIWDSYLWNEVTPMPTQRDRPACVGFDISVPIEEVCILITFLTFEKYKIHVMVLLGH